MTSSSEIKITSEPSRQANSCTFRFGVSALAPIRLARIGLYPMVLRSLLSAQFQGSVCSGKSFPPAYPIPALIGTFPASRQAARQTVPQSLEAKEKTSEPLA